MEDGDIQIRDLWGAISRLADLAESEGDRGCKAIQIYNPGAIRPPAARNAADLKGGRSCVACREARMGGSDARGYGLRLQQR